MSQLFYESLFSLLESIYPVSEQLKKGLIQNSKPISLSKGTILFNEKDIASNAYFIVKGFARTYYYKNEKEITNNLCPENRIFISASSFYTNQPSYETGELIEDSDMIVLTNENIEKLCLKYLELNFMIRRLVEIFYVVLDQRTYSIHMKTAEEKYNFLLQNNPDFFQRVSLGHIASFLGMTQETLSRLRARTGQ
jgi:CRP-like cAMP-binding protein